MDFGRPMIHTPGIVARSNIRLVPITHLGDDDLDRRVCAAANDAAVDLLWGNDRCSPLPTTTTAVDVDVVVDSSFYRERHLPPPTRLIRPNDLVVVFESFNDLNFVYATPGMIFSNRNGHFHHDDFIGMPYGCKIRSRNADGLGFLYLLRPTPELWARSLPHRTQIVHELDSSMIIHYLDIGPNMIVCESGTGSGAMSHAILRSIAPCGMLHTYEFNGMRAERARLEFEGHGLGHLVEVHHRDVCGKKKTTKKKRRMKKEKKVATPLGSMKKKRRMMGETTAGDDDGADDSDDIDYEHPDKDDDGDREEDDDDDDGGGGFRLGRSIAHAVFLDLPEPWLAVPHAAHVMRPNGKLCSYSPCVEQTQRTVTSLRRHGFHSIRTVEARLREYFVSEVEMEDPACDYLPDVLTEERASLERERCANGGTVLPPTTTTSTTLEGEDDIVAGAGGSSDRRKTKKKMLCARPFAQMRGHTAFLTFATAGNAPRPDPNEGASRG